MRGAAPQNSAAPGRVRAVVFASPEEKHPGIQRLLPAPFRVRHCFEPDAHDRLRAALPCAILLVLAALLIACSPAPRVPQPLADALPELPPDAFDASIRDRVRAAYEAVQAAPKDAVKNGELAMLLQAHDQFEHAEKFYRRAQSFSPETASWKYYLGIVQQRQAKHEDAVANFREALKLAPGDGPSRLHLAESLLAQGQLDESRELYQAVIDANSEIADAHYGLGRVFVAQRKPEASVKPFLRACELTPNFARRTTRWRWLIAISEKAKKPNSSSHCTKRTAMAARRRPTR